MATCSTSSSRPTVRLAPRRPPSTASSPATSREEGLIWKVWTEDAERGRTGGVYLFTDEALAGQYVVKHSARLGSFGITGIEHRSIGVQDGLSKLRARTSAERYWRGPWKVGRADPVQLRGRRDLAP